MTDQLLLLMSTLAGLFNGSLGWAILALSLAVRLALLPLTLNFARKMQANQQKVKALQPQLDAIKARLHDQPQQMMAEVSALYQANGVKLFDRSSLMGILIQVPVFGMMYSAITKVSAQGGPFLWLKNLASPDALLTAIVLVVTAVSAYYMPSAGGTAQTMMIVIQVIVTALFIWKLSAGLGLYWLASGSVGLLQSLMLRFEQRRRGASPA